MGCWNSTCLVSNLAVEHGDEVVGFILVPRSSLLPHMGGGYCYTTDMWQPMCVPFVGEYNDYGSMENIISTPATKLLTKHLGFKKEKDLIDYCERDDISNGMGKYGLCMIHKEMYDFIVSEEEEKLLEDIDELNHIIKHGVPKNTPEEDLFEPMLEFIMGDKTKRLLGCHYEGVYEDRQLLRKLVESKGSYDEMLEVKIVNSFLSRSRKMWMPNPSASQSRNFEHQTKIASFVMKKYQEKCEEYETENGETYTEW